VHYFRPGPWSKVLHYIRNRVPFGEKVNDFLWLFVELFSACFLFPQHAYPTHSCRWCYLYWKAVQKGGSAKDKATRESSIKGNHGGKGKMWSRFPLIYFTLLCDFKQRQTNYKPNARSPLWNGTVLWLDAVHSVYSLGSLGLTLPDCRCTVNEIVDAFPCCHCGGPDWDHECSSNGIRFQSPDRLQG
jgi:hypothetical protein